MAVSRETAAWKGLPEREILVRGAAELGLVPEALPLDALLAYLELLRRWNRRVNLIGPAEPAEEVVLHLLDSLSALPWLPAEPCRVLDLGSGGGLPALVLALCRPAWTLVLAESRGRKAAFLRAACRTLQIANAEVFEGRVGRKPSPPLAEAFDLVTARAFAPLKDLLPLARPCLKAHGQVLAYKGPGWEQEQAELLAGGGVALTEVRPVRLPFLGRDRVLLFWEIRPD